MAMVRAFYVVRQCENWQVILMSTVCMHVCTAEPQLSSMDGTGPVLDM